MIALKNVKKTYTLGKTEVHALRGVSLEIRKGDFVCVMGPSGSGKSTLLNIVGCLDRPNDGEVVINGTNVISLDRNSLADLRASAIGFIFQSFNLIPVLNVYENIEFPLYIKKEKISEADKKDRIMRLIGEVGLTEYVNHKPDELSGGQRQRVAIARALVTKPQIVLADEPTANLDSETARQIVRLMRQLNDEEQVTFVFSTHDQSITEYATSIHRLKDGALAN
ncbi:MAG TPA: ABC transporter ATP-binding protein [Spirochaetota bacterium]|nr:ABC transporter ATP-binding protein [Spirochaetota bacterium]HNT10587.1 ABC transporter ATP-binding protein [Spirochaetota bacterium]HNV47996.1 ABC transporter ATP-binding protein [Spirochaetota bacterium]HOS41722.1 ABC transporter ATP-binding protein [Spirochaetota bacterium]HPI23168.1 ABC transporter ATP-binding protein [Spirochaetota bacterium]